MSSASVPVAPVAERLPDRDAELVAWVVALLAAVADVVTTTIGLSVGLTEGNPVAAWVLSAGGVGGFVVLKLLVLLTVGYLGLLCFERRTIAPLVLAGTWGVVAAINVLAILF